MKSCFREQSLDRLVTGSTGVKAELSKQREGGGGTPGEAQPAGRRGGQTEQQELKVRLRATGLTHGRLAASGRVS